MTQIQRLLAIHGMRGTFRLIAAKLLGGILYFTPARRRARAQLKARDREFDLKWGVDTVGQYVPDQTDVVGANWLQGTRYEGVRSESMEQVLSELSIDFRQFTFIDFGSGKGRAVLTASQFPFKKVIGVEYSKQLTNIAQKNVEIFPASQKRCRAVELACADATEFPLPSGPLVLFFNNPFGKAIMSQVEENVRASLERDSRQIIVLYLFAVHPEVWSESTNFHERRASKAVSIYESKIAVPARAKVAA